MRVGGLTSTTVLLKAYDGVVWKNLYTDPRGVLQLLNVPWPLYLAPGRLVFYDDMEGVLKWSGTTGARSKDNTAHVFNGDGALKLLTGAVAGNACDAARHIPFTGRGKFRLLTHWHAWGGDVSGDNVKVRYVQFALDLYDGEYFHEISVRYLNYENTVVRRKWQYYTAAQGWADITGGAQYVECGANAVAHPVDNLLALDVDITGGTAKINRLVSNELDLKDLNLTSYSAAWTPKAGVGVLFCVTTDVAAAVAAYFDDVALGDLALP